MTPDDEIREIGELRAKHEAWRRELEARYPHPSAEVWMARAESARWQIAFAAQGLPLGDEVSGLVVLRETRGTLQWTARHGLFMVPVGVEPKVERTEGTIELTAEQLAGIEKAVAAAFRDKLESVPDGVYDGMPMRLIVRDATSELSASCNASDSGRHPTRVLARKLVALLR